MNPAKVEPRLSVQCNQAVELELGLHGLQKVRVQLQEQLSALPS